MKTKIILPLVLVVAVLISGAFADTTLFHGGSGTAEDPWLISGPEDLTALSERVNTGDAKYASGHYLMTCDISMLHNMEAKPIGVTKLAPFTGVFDGGGHTIRDLSISVCQAANEPEAYAGLFGVLDGGTVKNVSVLGSISGPRAGGIAGINIGGRILNCRSSCTVAGSLARNSAAGGIVGINEGGIVENSCFIDNHDSLSIGAPTYGGLAGRNVSGGSFVNCLCAWHDVTDNGFSGLISADGVFENCYILEEESGGAPTELTNIALSHCAYFTNFAGVLTAMDGNDQDSLPDTVFVDKRTLLDALNARALEQSGEYALWTQEQNEWPQPASLTVRREGRIDNFVQLRPYTVFEDVDETAWYGTENEGAVASVVRLGLMEGTAGGRFAPDDNMSVAEAVTIAARISSIYVSDGASFVQGEPWYAVYADYAVKNGIIAAGEFSESEMGRPATRAEAARIFTNALPKVELAERREVAALSDMSGAQRYYSEAILLYRAGVLDGVDEQGSFAPTDPLRRCAAAAIITRLVCPALRESG